MATTHETKAVRLMVLYRLRQEGLLEGVPDAKLARALGTRRETIWKDRQALATADALYEKVIAAQPWGPSGLSVAEAAAVLGCAAETLTAAIRDGLIEAHKADSGRWYIPPAEVERLKRPKESKS